MTAVEHPRGREHAVMISLTEAARRLSMHRATAIAAVKRGDFPVPVQQVGSRYIVAVAAVDAFLERMSTLPPTGEAG